jgi:hypothetical protein
MFPPPPDSTPYGAPRKGDEAAHALAKELLGNGTPPDEVRGHLFELGLDPFTADRYVAELKKGSHNKKKSRQDSRAAERVLRLSAANALKEAGRRNMRHGIFWFGFGLLITLATYALTFGGGHLCCRLGRNACRCHSVRSGILRNFLQGVIRAICSRAWLWPWPWPAGACGPRHNLVLPLSRNILR